MSSLGFGGGDMRDHSNSVDIASILAVARGHLNQGDPAAALQAVVAALRNIGGEQAVTSALRRAGQMHEHGIRANEAAADELSLLFAQCAIATFPPPSDFPPLSNFPPPSNFPLSLNFSHPSSNFPPSNFSPSSNFPPSNFSSLSSSNSAEHMSVESVVDPIGSCILAESGREQVVLDASADGSSFLCPQCCGIVSNLRRDEHFAYWCSGTPRSI